MASQRVRATAYVRPDTGTIDGVCVNDTDGDGICDEFETSGCLDSAACNYNPNATDEDNSCTYPDELYNCDGTCVNDVNDNGLCDELEVFVAPQKRQTTTIPTPLQTTVVRMAGRIGRVPFL